MVTGGGSGIGRALCKRFAAEDPAGIVVADVNGANALETANDIGGLAVATDVSVEADVVARDWIVVPRCAQRTTTVAAGHVGGKLRR